MKLLQNRLPYQHLDHLGKMLFRVCLLMLINCNYFYVGPASKGFSWSCFYLMAVLHSIAFWKGPSHLYV